MRKKCFLKKLLITLLLIITLFNFVFSNGIGTVVLAADPDESVETETEDELISTRSNGLATIGQWLIMLLVAPAATACQKILYSLASSGGLNSTDVSTFITPLDIFFNKFTLLDINIFSTTDGQGNQLDTSSLVYKLRTNTAFFYYIIRSIALGLLLVILIINLIKVISVNSTSAQKAEAKKALSDWVVSLVLVMFMHILIIFIININNIIIDVISKLNDANNAASGVSSMMDAIFAAIFSSSFILSIASLIVYTLMTFQTVKYFLIYLQRLLTCLFLIMISPIMPVFFSTERTIGNKSVSLNGWFREFIYNVFLQVIHALIYVVIVSVALNALASQNTSISGIGNLASAIIAILAMFFIGKAEKLLKSILGFDRAITVSNNVLQSAYNGVANTATVARNTMIATAVGGVVPSMNVQFGQNVGNQLGNNTLGQSGASGLGGVSGANGTLLGNLSGGLSQIRNSATSFVRDTFSSPNQRENLSDGTQANENTETPSENSNENADASNENVNADGSNENLENGTNIVGAFTDNSGDSELADKQNNLEQTVKNLHNTVNNNTTNNNEETTTNVNSETVNEENNDIVVGTDPSLLEEFKKAMTEIENSNSLVKSWDKDIEAKLDELKRLEEKLDPAQARDIERTVVSMTSPEEIKAYIKELGVDTAQGKYAAALSEWLKYSSEKDELNDKKRDLIDEYRGKGLSIDETLKDKLLGPNGAATLQKLTTSGENVETTTELAVQGSEVEHEVDVSGSTELANMVKNMPDVKKSATNALDIINVIKGKIGIEGEITEGDIDEFSVEVSKKLSQGAYSENNFNEALQKVKTEGDNAVRALQNYQNNPSLDNISQLSQGGREFVILQEEAKHAGYMITEATAYQSNQAQVTNQITQSARVVEHMPINSNTQNVIDRLNNRRSNT
jgi:hypothetical protein